LKIYITGNKLVVGLLFQNGSVSRNSVQEGYRLCYSPIVHGLDSYLIESSCLSLQWLKVQKQLPTWLCIAVFLW